MLSTRRLTLQIGMVVKAVPVEMQTEEAAPKDTHAYVGCVLKSHTHATHTFSRCN